VTQLSEMQEREREERKATARAEHEARVRKRLAEVRREIDDAKRSLWSSVRDHVAGEAASKTAGILNDALSSLDDAERELWGEPQGATED